MSASKEILIAAPASPAETKAALADATFAAAPAHHGGAEAAAARRAALEEAAALLAPVGPRPCNCEHCDCGNPGDHAHVVAWDEANANASAIRGLAAKDRLSGAAGDGVRVNQYTDGGDA